MDVSCPACRAKTPWEGNPYRPFCSERCRLLDLDRWFREQYRIPAEPDESEGGDGGEPPVH